MRDLLTNYQAKALEVKMMELSILGKFMKIEGAVPKNLMDLEISDEGVTYKYRARVSQDEYEDREKFWSWKEFE